jgi:actin-like ATPase involved in cell morphogenesis
VIVSVTVEETRTEIVASRGEVVYSHSVRHGLDTLDRGVVEHVREAHGVIPDWSEVQLRDIVLRCDGLTLTALAAELTERFRVSVTTMAGRPSEA